MRWRYLHVNTLFIRQIDAIERNTVFYHDQYGQGRCGKQAFLKVCPTAASLADIAQAGHPSPPAASAISGAEFSTVPES